MHNMMMRRSHRSRWRAVTDLCSALCYSLGVAVIGHAVVQAQDPANGADLSGAYVGEEGHEQPQRYLFTAEGQRKQVSHDPFAGNPSQWDCIPEVMPQLILWPTTVMEITHEDASIVMTVERGATVRTIRLDGSLPLADQPHTELGYSVGHWSGEELIIETTHLLGGVLYAEEGGPVSREARTTERYWRNPGERNLHMELLIDDPVNYMGPVAVEREWIWSPQEQVHPYNCFSLELGESGPADMEDLKRRLEQF